MWALLPHTRLYKVRKLFRCKSPYPVKVLIWPRPNLQKQYSNQNGKDAYHLTVTDSHGNKGERASNKVYYIDGNLWLHNKKSYSFKFYASQDESNKI